MKRVAGGGRLGRELVATLLVPALVLGALPAPALPAVDTSAGALYGAATAGALESSDVAVPADVAPPAVEANRTVPAVDKPAQAQFSARPQKEEIARARVFGEPLTPIGGEPSDEENAALGRALLAFQRDGSMGRTQGLEALLTARGAGPWRASLLLNLGLTYMRTYRYTRAEAALQEVWELTKAERDLAGRSVADRALGQLLWLHTHFAHEPKLHALLEEIAGRPVGGATAEHVRNARLEAWGLANRHHDAISSGPAALSHLLRFTKAGRWDDPRIQAFHGQPAGWSLVQMRDLAGEVGLPMRMAFRGPGAALVAPAMMHLRAEHFTALLGAEHGSYKLADSILGGELWLSAQAMEEESSGYFLVPEGLRLPKGWREVEEKEAIAVRGRCHFPVPECRGACCPTAGGSEGGGGGGGCSGGSCSGGSTGMARYALMTLVAGLQVNDTPVGYQPAYGPGVSFTLTYKQWDSSSYAGGAGPPMTYTFSNLGTRWSHSFMAWIEDNPSEPYAMAYVYRPGGGVEDFDGFDGQAYARDRTSRALLRRASSSPIRYEREAPDGSKEVYAQSDGATSPRRVFLTQVVDAQGDALNLTYDGQLRLVAIQDTTGLVTTLSYDDADAPFLITSVRDPFGRTARLRYTLEGSVKRLTGITDVVGMTSEFEYGVMDSETDFIRAMKTPYGTTRFRSGSGIDLSDPNWIDQAHWWIEATDPLGGTERVEYSDMSDTGVPAAEPTASVPAGFATLNNGLDRRNSFYWDKRAFALATASGGLDYSKAKVTHWLWKGTWALGHAYVSETKHSEKQPLEGRVWYDYIEQGAAQTQSTFDLPVKVARALDDGSSQIRRYEYNDLGRVTRVTDPLDRMTLYTYAANGIDLLEVRQVNGAGSDLLTSSAYNSQHQPLTTTDAAGQTTTYTYDARGRLSTVVTPPRNGPTGTPLSLAERTTTYAYFADNAPLGAGRLQSITGPSTPQGAPVTTYAYDAFGRVRTTTDADGYTLTYDYDALDRLTKVTYPDGTYEQTVYNRLDAEKRRDRLGRWSHTFHDALRRVVATRDPLGRTVTQEWCPCGSLDKLIDANGNATTWERDTQGRITREIRADGKDRLFVYEATTSRLKEAHDFMTPRQVKSYEYFLDDSLKRVSYVNAAVPTPAVSYTYDPVYSRLATMTDGIGTTSYAYNPITATPTLGAGQLASVDGPLSNDTVGYSYDELGRISTRGLSAFSSTFKYDALGRLATQVSPVGSFNYGYDGVTGRALSLSYPNGQTTSYLYFPNNGDHRLQEIKHLAPGGALLSRFNYTYDVVGNIKTWRQEMAPDPAQVYELAYDLADQFTAATLKSTDPTPVVLKRYGYTFDPAGNRTTEQKDDVAVGASYNNRNQLLSTQPGGALLFRGTTNEAATVTVQGQTATVTAPPESRFEKAAPVGTGSTNVVVQATDPSGNVRTNTYQVSQTGATATYTHDANGNMTSDGTKTYVWDAEDRLTAVRQGATTLASFVYDGAGRRHQKVAAGATHTYISDGNSVIEERVGTGQTFRYVEAPGVDRHLAMEDGASATYYVADHLGSIVQATNSTGAVTLSRKYDPWGNPLVGASAAGWSFTGREWDPETGLAYHRARYLDPKLGRFLGEDPIGIEGGVNFYVYADNAPAMKTDPMGLDAGSGMQPNMFKPTCLQRAFEKGQQLGGAVGYRYGHCMAACEARKCGYPPQVVKVLGYANEWAQTVTCFIDGTNCHSARAPIDYKDNRVGFSCPDERTCEEQCSIIKRTPKKTRDQYGPHCKGSCREKDY